MPSSVPFTLLFLPDGGCALSGLQTIPGRPDKRSAIRQRALQHVFTVVHRRCTKVGRQRLADIREGFTVT
ncbi:hypothetical protein E2Z92_06235 [Salmonella enterica subsp. enterica serovar Virchow]|nr:hypothetical protein [Salmonella enterica subsp. enterica serovar Virchow]